MLHRLLQITSLARLGTALAIVSLGVISAPLAAMEEITVTGDQAAASIRADDARFRAEMNQFVKTVGLRFKADLAFDLKQSVTPPLRLAGSLASNRG
jgi:hypothetical protein